MMNILSILWHQFSLLIQYHFVLFYIEYYYCLYHYCRLLNQSLFHIKEMVFQDYGALPIPQNIPIYSGKYNYNGK